MATAFFRNRTSRKVHRGFVRKRGAKLYCGKILVLRPGEHDPPEYRPKKDFGPTYERFEIPQFGSGEGRPDGELCGRCSG